jgi:hypothetical protein
MLTDVPLSAVFGMKASGGQLRHKHQMTKPVLIQVLGERRSFVLRPD